MAETLEIMAGQGKITAIVGGMVLGTSVLSYYGPEDSGLMDSHPGLQYISGASAILGASILMAGTYRLVTGYLMNRNPKDTRPRSTCSQ